MTWDSEGYVKFKPTTWIAIAGLCIGPAVTFSGVIYKQQLDLVRHDSEISGIKTAMTEKWPMLNDIHDRQIRMEEKLSNLTGTHVRVMPAAKQE